MPKLTILLVDDEKYTLDFLTKTLGDRGFNILTAMCGEDAISIVHKENIDLVFLDQRMPGMSGLETLKVIKTHSPDTVVVMMTGYGTIAEAVEAMRVGAYHYLTKPFENIDEIDVVVDKAVGEKALLDEVRYLRRQVKDPSFSGMIGKSEAFQKVINLIRKVAPTKSNILLQGESGTGKELIARTIHQQSFRAGKKFIAVDCGAVPETLLEGMLFGFERGAFTGALKTTKGYFEEANGGTIFLDEITETSQKFQTSLLRVIQEREFSRIGDMVKMKTDFRLIAATNKDIQSVVKRGEFREDLYYRINVVPIFIPSLRDRREDIPLLANYLVERFNQKLKKNMPPLSREVLSVLSAAEWNGNVRELENIIERVMVVKEKGDVTIEDLPEYLIKIEDKDMKTEPLSHYRDAKDDFEKGFLEEVLKKTEGNITKAAKECGISRQNLYYKLKKYGIKVEGSSEDQP